MKNLKKLASAVVILTLVASATGCDAVKKLGKKSSIDNDMVMDAAEDFSEALIALDAKKIEDGAFELKDTTKTLIEEYAFGPESEDVYKEWLKTQRTLVLMNTGTQAHKSAKDYNRQQEKLNARREAEA